MLKKFQQSVKNSIQKDFATNKCSLFLAICMPILILQGAEILLSKSATIYASQNSAKKIEPQSKRPLGL